MKKVLSLLSLGVITLGFVSCSSDDLSTPESNILTENVQKFGTRSSEVSLYFGSNEIVGTRAADVNGNMWGDDIMPAYPTQEEVDGILAYVRSHTGGSVAWPGYTYYFVQHMTGAHNKYSYVDWNNAPHNDIDGTSHLDKLEIEEDRAWKSWELDGNGDPYSWASLFVHVNNFNNGQNNNAATHNSTLMTEGFKSARAHDSYGNTNVDDWKLFYWNGNYYLGIDYKMTKDDGKILPDGIYDDWIVKILPGRGETPVVPTPDEPTPTPDDPTPTPTPDDPTPTPDPTTPATVAGEVEFDIHQQEHKDWNEIKTSIHVRDTAAVHVFLPIPFISQAVADDFDIRTGSDYTYLSELTYNEIYVAKFEFAGTEFSFPVEIQHNEAGIDILIDCTTDEAKAALKLARGVFDDGITFEIHSYVNPDVTSEQIWNWLKTVQLPSTKTSQWPQTGDISTHVHGQVSSAYYKDETISFDERP